MKWARVCKIMCQEIADCCVCTLCALQRAYRQYADHMRARRRNIRRQPSVSFQHVSSRYRDISHYSQAGSRHSRPGSRRQSATSERGDEHTGEDWAVQREDGDEGHIGEGLDQGQGSVAASPTRRAAALHGRSSVRIRSHNSARSACDNECDAENDRVDARDDEGSEGSQLVPTLSIRLKQVTAKVRVLSVHRQHSHIVRLCTVSCYDSRDKLWPSL